MSVVNIPPQGADILYPSLIPGFIVFRISDTTPMRHLVAARGHFYLQRSYHRDVLSACHV